MHSISERLDARGLNCPLPILRARKAINNLNPGDILEIASTDPGSVKDMAAFCAQTGNQLLESGVADDGFVFLIQKA